MKDHRVYSRQALINSGVSEEIIDSLEITKHEDHGGTTSRFQVLYPGPSTHLIAPGCSFVNRKNDDLWYIWTGADTDEGAIYIGETDFHEMATLVGYVKDYVDDNRKAELERLKAEYHAAVVTICDLRAAIAALVSGIQPYSESELTEPSADRVDEVAAKRSQRTNESTEGFGLDFDERD